MKNNAVLYNVSQLAEVSSAEQQTARDNIGAQAKLTAGANINIDANNVISADVSTLATKDELNTGLATKQDRLQAGANISIQDNVISATGGGVSSTEWGGYVATVTKVLDGTGTKIWDPGSDSDWTLTESYFNCDASTSAVRVAPAQSANNKLMVSIQSWAPEVLPCWSSVFVDENANFGQEMASWGHPIGGYCQVCSGMNRVWFVRTLDMLDENGISSLTSTNKSGTLKIEFSFWFPLQA